ncbi:hypothetical protein OB236_38385 [Paenibacillus sp. WQ 127069]|uniref:Uncharacterized protein n=1 Tax=Paenibacillus baimaensis TaxID=2982185 RepID=A0ABT2UTN2_9BACL|nr:hypothetical protein [Paenibacillus sp. WQ 127069]MCU6798010.1 hypothetical protein [Paenibacillus sp. WQ 127069]
MTKGRYACKSAQQKYKQELEPPKLYAYFTGSGWDGIISNSESDQINDIVKHSLSLRGITLKT